MRKIILLSVVLSIVFSGCLTTLADIDTKLETIARSYRITERVEIAVIGNDWETIETAKEVFSDFGFIIVQDDYQGYVDYIIEARRKDQVQKKSFDYFMGYSSRQKVVVKAVIIVPDKKLGTERYYDGVQECSSRQHYGGYYYQSASYQVDPGYIAFKGALMEAIGEFIDEKNIAHRRPSRR